VTYDIFLSYSRTDEAIAGQFIEAAQSHGLKVWYDQFISGGRDWRDSIVESLRDSRALVILFSEASNSSRQLIKELAIADNFSKLVIPVLIENTEPRGAYLYEMASRNWIKLYPNPERKLAGLIANLASQLGVEGSPSPQFAENLAAVKAPLFQGAPATTGAVRAAQPAKEDAAPWFPLWRFDLLILIPLLIFCFVRQLQVSDKSGLGFCAIILCVYMLVIARRNAALNRSIFSLKSFASYAVVTLLLFPFGYLPEILAARKIDPNYVAGSIVATLLFAVVLGIIANTLQYILRKIFQRRTFRDNLKTV
jgi:hypothetical protein